MGIKGGSGRGSVDKQGDRENVPGGVGSSRKRNRVPFPPPPPKKPIERIKDDLFEEKPEFRLGYYVVEQEFDDYLICHGFDPNSPKPASEITPDAYKTIKVAKPWELQRTLWDGETIAFGDIDYTYIYSDDEPGVRTASWTDENGDEQSEEQRIEPPYLVTGKEIQIIAAQLKKSAWVEGLETEDSAGTRIRWMDFNAAGRRWKSVVEAEEPVEDEELPDDTGGCSCDNCQPGVEIVDGTECCYSHLKFTLTNPWIVCADTNLELQYITGDQWLTEEFDGPDCDGMHNTYRWLMTIDVDGTSTLTLVLEDDNGCPDVCITYARDGFDCQCDNEFTLKKPNGKHIGVERHELTCSACAKPKVIDALLGTGDYCKVLGNPSTTVPYRAGAYIVNISDMPAEFDYANGSWLCEYTGESGGLAFEYSDGSLTITLRIGGVHGVNCFGTSQSCVSAAITMIHSGTGESCTNWYPIASYNTPGDCSFLDRIYFNLCGVFPSGNPLNACLNTSSATVTADPVIAADQLPGECGGSGLPLTTSTGACEDAACTDTAAPTDPDAGCCCYLGEAFDYWEESDCTAFGGTWSNPCDAASCTSLGACCLPDGSCVDNTSFMCSVIGGDYQDGYSCDEDPCTGACCSAAGGCIITTEGSCTTSCDKWLGVGTDCSASPCNSGACCETVGSNCNGEGITWEFCCDEYGSGTGDNLTYYPNQSCASAGCV